MNTNLPNYMTKTMLSEDLSNPVVQSREAVEPITSSIENALFSVNSCNMIFLLIH